MQANERMLEAIKASNAGALQAALDDGADPNLRVDGFPVLHQVAIMGEPVLVEVLLKAGADIDARDKRADRTAVMYLAILTCRPEQTESLKRLISAGADINAKDETTRQTALDMAAGWRNEGTGRLLLVAGGVAAGRATKRWAEKLQGPRGRVRE